MPARRRAAGGCAPGGLQNHGVATRRLADTSPRHAGGSCARRPAEPRCRDAPPCRHKPPPARALARSQALQGIGYTEDRGASAVLECQGTYKYQHDTDKDLKFIHVFPRVDTSAAEAGASSEAAAAAEASRAANPEWSCVTAGLDQFMKTVEKKVTSFQQKQALLRIVKQKAAQVAEFEERISNRGTLTSEEQKLYENAVDLQEKVSALGGTARSAGTVLS